VAVLSRAAAVAVACAAGCYDPTLRDCTVQCSGVGDCASGQRCETGWCVATASEATCGPGRRGVDSGVASVDSGTGSDDLVPLQVQVMGPGQVTLDAAATCVNDCMYMVVGGVPHRLVATAAGSHSFQMWSGACAGSAETCIVTPPTAMPAVARFDH
jgi:hypothetical protein